MSLGGPLGNNFFICPCDLEMSRSWGHVQGHAAKLLVMPRKVICHVNLKETAATIGMDMLRSQF